MLLLLITSQKVQSQMTKPIISQFRRTKEDDKNVTVFHSSNFLDILLKNVVNDLNKTTNNSRFSGAHCPI